MTSRDRVLAALTHTEPDRVPVYFGGTSSFLTDEAYFNLIKYLGLGAPVRPYRMGHTGNHVDNRVLEVLGADVRFLWLRIGLEERRLSDDTVLDDWGIPIRMVDGYGSRVRPPLKELDPAENPDQASDALSGHGWPDPYDPRRAEGLEEEARRLRSETDACLVARSPQSAGFLEYGAWLRGDENFLADLFLAEEFSSALFDKICELQLGYYGVLLGAVGSYVDIVETSEDYGSASGLLISPETFRKYIKPRRTAINAFIKSKCPHVKILHHSCGAISPIIPDLIETGIDILNPVQPNLPGMAGEELKAEFGDVLCFCGGADMITLATGSDDDIENDVRARMSEYASKGGYLFSTSNHIQRDTSPERIMRLFEFARKYGRYV